MTGNSALLSSSLAPSSGCCGTAGCGCHTITLVLSVRNKVFSRSNRRQHNAYDARRGFSYYVLRADGHDRQASVGILAMAHRATISVLSLPTLGLSSIRLCFRDASLRAARLFFAFRSGWPCASRYNRPVDIQPHHPGACVKRLHAFATRCSGCISHM